MKMIKVVKIDIDTLGGGDNPTWGKLTVEIEGRTVAVQLDQSQIDNLTGIAGGIGAEIMAELFNEKKAAFLDALSDEHRATLKRLIWASDEINAGRKPAGVIICKRAGRTTR